MTPFETAVVILGKASLFDSRIPQADKAVAQAWAEALGDINTRDAVQAVIDHYNEPSPDRIVPGDVRARVRKIRADRVQRFGNSEPDYNGDDVREGLRAVREFRRRIADGQTPDPEPRPNIEGRARVQRMIEGRCELPADVRHAFSQAEQDAKRKRADAHAAAEQARAERRARITAAEAEIDRLADESA
jgi:hypothetical protein